MVNPTERPRVSVLVPIYNAEKYLETCLASIADQILENIEIICVNDGSTDKSLEIIKKFADGDPRFVIIDKKNTGYGDSLNKAIKKARADFIGIVEADDFVDADMYAELYALAKKHHADVVRANYFEFRDDTDTVVKICDIDQPGRIIDTTEDTRIFYKPPAIWSGLYKKDFLKKNDIWFQKTPGASYQDASFNFESLAADGNLLLTDKPYYHYRRDNVAASVKSKDPAKLYVVNDEYAAVEKWLKAQDRYQVFKFVLQPVKFAAYHWNMLRLDDPKDLKKYVLRLRAEFYDAKLHGLLKSYYFPKKHWRALKMILKYPPGVFLSFFNIYAKEKRKKL